MKAVPKEFTELMKVLGKHLHEFPEHYGELYVAWLAARQALIVEQKRRK